MPKKGDKNMSLYEKKTVNDSVDEKYNKTVRSQLKASEKYDRESVDNIRLRTPRGWKDIMKEYVSSATLEDGTPKYNSVNDMLVQLIRKEIGIED